MVVLPATPCHAEHHRAVPPDFHRIPHLCAPALSNTVHPFLTTRFDMPSNTEQGVQRSVRQALDDDPKRID